MQRVQTVYKNFRNPLLVLIGIILYGLFLLSHLPFLATIAIFLAILIGSYTLFFEAGRELLKKHFALDYIAILAVVVSVITGEYLVAAIIALMISSGDTLEEYGAKQAKRSLTKLVDRIPQDVILWQDNNPGETIKIGSVEVGQQILIRKGEVIPLDGQLVSEYGLTDESSLTGEPYIIDKVKGDIIRSGTVNTGEPIVIKVTRAEADSTYRKIIQMVQSAQEEKAPLVRLADKYSTFFTLITLAIATFAFFHLGGLSGALAVLVIATPCPLIIATPIALLGGVNAGAKKRIIIKKLASLEVLQRVNTIVFDKTGTITLGQPQLTDITVLNKNYTRESILAIASAIERNSLHPLAKAVISKAKDEKINPVEVSNVEEELGQGISGVVNNKRFSIKRVEQNLQAGIMVEVKQDNQDIATLAFADVPKADSRPTINKLKKLGYELMIFTGDRQSAADKIVEQLGTSVTVKAEMKPEDKQQGIAELKKQHRIIAMIGDGINDAPALALADVGLVFSNQEQTAASEAADIVILGGDFELAALSLTIAKRTIAIAVQSILWGIGLSIAGMILASFGLIPPLLGAGLQEAIDVAVILNALRASRV
ncbi:MAG TPA: heavy metal translocating P-type ATPase [Patescibacteria group bacterium]|nr:heavy metal translocating P-type ATPase [Patescibacteria group bacterium]